MEAESKGSFAFTNLSRELRDHIYEILLQSSRTPPVSPDHGGARKYPSEEDEEYFETCNCYPAEDLQSTAAPLQLTCRQVHDEVQEAVLRLKISRNLPYKLDLMMLDEAKLYPTWLAFPAFVDDIPRLDVDFRLFGDVEGKQSAMRGGCGGPPLLIWSLFRLTERFLRRGPDFLASCEPNRYLSIDELAVNVITPSPPPPNGYADRTTFLRWGDRKGLVHPEDMVSFLVVHMDILLRRSRYTAPYARLVFQRVKRMTFSLDGMVRKSWDLTALVPEYTPPPPPPSSSIRLPSANSVQQST
ncbi:MAG: hypothetical protein LQ346_008936 [Caloplaca aetnensis]|nr:MAG: hypothetical protein LQ346_008936 [Caloplaca aetnensis]